jgi:hypothetical protein
MEEATDEGGLAVVDVADDDDVHLAMVFGGVLRGAHFEEIVWKVAVGFRRLT